MLVICIRPYVACVVDAGDGPPPSKGDSATLTLTAARACQGQQKQFANWRSILGTVDHGSDPAIKIRSGPGVPIKPAREARQVPLLELAIS